VADLDPFGGDEGDAGKATVVANRDNRARLARGQHHGVVGRQGVAGRPRAQGDPLPHDDGAAAHGLHHRRAQPATAPSPDHAIGAQAQGDVGQKQQPAQLVGDAPGAPTPERDAPWGGCPLGAVGNGRQSRLFGFPLQLEGFAWVLCFCIGCVPFWGITEKDHFDRPA